MGGGIITIATAGSVDNGKSTLIGRLLFDTKSIFDDQLSAIRQTSVNKGKSELDLALFTDGLREEVDLGITIDVAYRYFSTPNRKFILADTPGHLEFTRNMITGASNADAIIILIDVTQGITEQSKRHAFIAGLLRIPKVIVCINKMDLINWDHKRYQLIVDEFRSLSIRLHVENVVFIPISALDGDNVVNRSEKLKWYEGQSLLNILESIPNPEVKNESNLRCIVQCQLGKHDSNFYYGVSILQGRLTANSTIVVYPSKKSFQISQLMSGYNEVESIESSCVGKLILDAPELKRGDLLISGINDPRQCLEMNSIICWLDIQNYHPKNKLVLLHVTGEYTIESLRIEYIIDLESLNNIADIQELKMNDIAKVQLILDRKMTFENYETNKEMGSFILVDPNSNRTVAAGMIR